MTLEKVAYFLFIIKGVVVDHIEFILAVIIISIVLYFYRIMNRLSSIYRIIWKKSSSLKANVILRERPFNEYHFMRNEDKLINEGLINGNNLLIKGRPLASKSRAAYQALFSLNQPSSVIIPRWEKIETKSFLIPKIIIFWRKKILLLNDFHRFVELEHFDTLLEKFIETDTIIIACCRSGIEYKTTINKMSEWNIDLVSIFGGNIIVLPNISRDEGRNIAIKVEKSWNDVEFDGSIGSIFLPLSEMRRRFDESSIIEKTILRSLKILYISGIFEERVSFPLEWIKIICVKYGLEGKEFEWAEWHEKLIAKEFIRLKRDNILIEEIYLERIIELEKEGSDLDIFQDMLDTFSDVPYALFKLGNRSYMLGSIELEKADYMKIAIKAYEEALKVTTLDRFPMDYAMTQNNLGIAYGTLAEVKDKSENCKSAIKAFEEALILFTKEDFPEMYKSMAQNLKRVIGMCER